MISEPQIQEMLLWIDKIPLSRPKKNFSRDFSDGMLAAEVLKYYYPKVVDLHNYPSTSSVQQKLENWRILNNKVLKKLGIKVTDNQIQSVASCSLNAAEEVMVLIMQKINTNSPSHSNSFKGEPIEELASMTKIPNYEETIQMLQTKIEKLETLIALKDRKIEQLRGSNK
eukprot:NODE_50_length_31184_cov_0.705099.p24 type:complete len:170 gc:universal NODE_50_length_31184_cov_0.705099:2204-2713(+)